MFTPQQLFCHSEVIWSKSIFLCNQPLCKMATYSENHVEIVLPGDTVTDLLISEKATFRLGPGLRQESEQVIACKCGVLRRKEPNLYWVDNHQKRVSLYSFFYFYFFYGLIFLFLFCFVIVFHTVCINVLNPVMNHNNVVILFYMKLYIVLSGWTEVDTW